jgi:hypothetical protein
VQIGSNPASEGQSQSHVGSRYAKKYLWINGLQTIKAEELDQIINFDEVRCSMKHGSDVSADIPERIPK